MSAATFDQVVVIGDIGGHRRVLRHVLRTLGVDVDSAAIPEGTCIIQVGDLIGGRFEDASVIDDVDRLLDANPGRWIQLAGNWEARHLGGPVFGKRGHADVPLSDDAEMRLRAWWKATSMVVAATVRSRCGDVGLITHAGVTRPFWLRELNAERDASLCASRLNTLARAHPRVVFRPGMMLGASPHQRPPGPVWAAAGQELWPSWSGHAMPFHQIHGHTSAYNFRGRTWFPDVPQRLRQSAEVVQGKRHVRWANDGRTIVCVDPGLGRTPRLADLVPLVFSAATVEVPFTAVESA